MRWQLVQRYGHRKKLHGLCAVLVALLLLVTISTVVFLQPSGDGPSPGTVSAVETKVTIIVASQMSDDTTWLETSFPHWHKMIYVTDDPNAALTVPANSGREAMVYLT